MVFQAAQGLVSEYRTAFNVNLGLKKRFETVVLARFLQNLNDLADDADSGFMPLDDDDSLPF